MHDFGEIHRGFDWEMESANSGYMGETYGSGVGGAQTNEMELASQLLEVVDEAELDHFLGDLLQKASQAAGQFIQSDAGRALGGMLKGVVKKALPVVGGALGNFVAPGVGGLVGSKLATAAGNMFGLELEGMSYEDQEFEVARRVVRLANTAAHNAAVAPHGNSPQAVARNALNQAAQQHAPGLVGAAQQAPFSNGGYDVGVNTSDLPHSGRWVRRGHKIVILLR